MFLQYMEEQCIILLASVSGGGSSPVPSERGEKKMGYEMLVLTFLVIATGYIISINQGNKK